MNMYESNVPHKQPPTYADTFGSEFKQKPK
ncbi:MAG: hypothetical protein SCARUB_02335 [Candidatus Scalindua rubra]|uniref:Uncharacterized protein n=1 Tax=Candidatus Scalindua rubra TaxID=1872076 RepID=A0A1E3XA65_9BACT|nr:MAG: hypothetical protein SCARUB_02335 [Candidatus Scalindua rubra]